MRREFIIVLLGIICVSTMSSFLGGYVQIDTQKVLLDTVAGSVGAGNFSYWQLGHTGPLLVELTSLSGDADLYVSDSVRPSYEIDKNNFSSVTCGPDLVSIPQEFPRPIGIGVFGHWSHHISEYSIQVFLDASAVLTHQQVLAAERNQRINEKTEIPKEVILGIKYAYRILEEYLSQSTYLAGDNMTIADICAVATMSSLEGMYPVDEKRYPKTRRWLDTMYSKDFCRIVNQPGCELHVAHLKAAMENNKFNKKAKL